MIKSTPNIIRGIPNMAPAILIVNITPMTINIAPNIMASNLPVNRSINESTLHIALNMNPGKNILKPPPR